MRYPVIESGPLVVTFGILGISYGPMGSLLPELFDTRCRHSGAGIAHNLGGILGSALPPLIADPLAVVYGSVAIGVLMGALALVSLVCVVFMKETRQADLGSAQPQAV